MIQSLIQWAEKQDWSKAMSECEQDAIWHAEGDVWTHTKMVMQQLPNAPYWASFTPEEQEVLIYSALFHDVAKPRVSKEVNGRIRSPKHSQHGESIARQIMYHKGFDIHKREAICNLVRYHCKPPNILEFDFPEREVMRLSTLVGDSKMLYVLSWADIFGRTSDDQDKILDKINLWKDIAEELNCFHKPFEWHNEYTKLKFLRDKELHWMACIDFVPNCTVHVMCGLPASGKSTTARSLELPIISLDGIRKECGFKPTEAEGQVQQEAKARIKAMLREKKDFVLDATNLFKITRERWMRIFLAYGARVELYLIERPFSQIIEDNNKREGLEKVPEHVIHGMLDKMEMPKIDECHKMHRR